MVFPWAGACCTGVVVVHVTAMSATVVPVVKTLDWCGRLAAWVLVVKAVSAAICAAATIVATAAVCVLVAIVVAAAAAATVCVLVRTATTVVVATTAVVSATTVAASSTIVATALVSTTASARWALLVVDDAGRRLAISDGLAEHLKLPLDCYDVGRVALECFLGGGVRRAKVENHIREGCRCVFVGRRHAVAVLTRRDGGKRRNLDCILPE